MIGRKPTKMGSLSLSLFAESKVQRFTYLSTYFVQYLRICFIFGAGEGMEEGEARPIEAGRKGKKEGKRGQKLLLYQERFLCCNFALGALFAWPPGSSEGFRTQFRSLQTLEVGGSSEARSPKAGEMPATNLLTPSRRIGWLRKEGGNDEQRSSACGCSSLVGVRA